METYYSPVLIVGGGPVGLALAADLGWRGTDCMLIDQGDGVIDLPRANAVDIRTMEFCRRWGIAEQVRQAGVPPDFPHTALYLTSLTGFKIARFERGEHGGGGSLPVSPERPQRCNQLFFDPLMRNHVRHLDPVMTRFNCRLESFEQEEASVTARAVDSETGEEIEITSRFMVACCGGRGPIRDQLGIPIGDDGVFGYPISIFFRCPDLFALHDKGPAALHFLIDAGGVWATLIPLDGKELWRITLHGGMTPTDPDDIDADEIIRRVAGTAFTYELISKGSWVRREMVAPQYRFGNVFLAGDCAHQNTPTGGYGMNTGMGDAADLGWKLSAVWEGWGGEALLDSYEAERRPVAERNVAEATANFRRRNLATGPAISEDSEDGAALRGELGEKLAAANARQHRDHGIALGHIYSGSPICVLEDEVPAPDTVEKFIPTARPGARAPHAAMANGGSILDLFGRGFVLLNFGAVDTVPLEEAAQGRGVPLWTYPVDDPAIAELYERKLVLVRPDGHVAWRGNALPDDPVALIDRVRGAEK